LSEVERSEYLALLRHQDYDGIRSNIVQSRGGASVCNSWKSLSF
jgi:hypothetical protein